MTRVLRRTQRDYSLVFKLSVVDQVEKGEMIYNSNPALNSFLGWVCVQDGNPGIWKPFGKITE